MSDVALAPRQVNAPSPPAPSTRAAPAAKADKPAPAPARGGDKKAAPAAASKAQASIGSFFKKAPPAPAK